MSSNFDKTLDKKSPFPCKSILENFSGKFKVARRHFLKNIVRNEINERVTTLWNVFFKF